MRIKVIITRLLLGIVGGLFALCDLYAQSFNAEPKKVAIWVKDNAKTSEGLKALIEGFFTDAINQIDGYKCYDRSQIDAIMKELNFQESGLVNENEIKRLGEMAGVDYVLVTQISKLDDQNLVFMSKIIGVVRSDVDRSGTVMCQRNANAYEYACQKLVEKVFRITLSGSGTAYNSVESSMPTRINADVYLKKYTETADGLNLQMVYVEGGEFDMGCTYGQEYECNSNEQNHRVSLDGYYIGVLEVTQGQWQKIMGTNVYQQWNKKGSGNVGKVGENYPMYYVSWDEAMLFCQKLSLMTGKNYTLPTEAQWEYAARGGIWSTDNKYSGGRLLQQVGWYAGNSGGVVHPCGMKSPNELGIYDMSGNVWEWCKDWYTENYMYEKNNPQGPSDGKWRINRGGSFGGGATYSRVSNRDKDTPNSRYEGLGFRIVLIP